MSQTTWTAWKSSLILDSELAITLFPVESTNTVFPVISDPGAY